MKLRDAPSQSLCFQGVLLRGMAKKTLTTGVRLNPFVFRAYYCVAERIHNGCRVRLNPFVFRAYYCGIRAVFRQNQNGLNPFVFRAYYCGSSSTKNYVTANVSIPLFSGRITASSWTSPCPGYERRSCPSAPGKSEAF